MVGIACFKAYCRAYCRACQILVGFTAGPPADLLLDPAVARSEESTAEPLYPTTSYSKSFCRVYSRAAVEPTAEATLDPTIEPTAEPPGKPTVQPPERNLLQRLMETLLCSLRLRNLSQGLL